MRCAEYIGYPIFLVESLFFIEVQCRSAENIMFLQTTKTKNKKIKNKDTNNSLQKTGYLIGKGEKPNEKICYSP